MILEYSVLLLISSIHFLLLHLFPSRSLILTQSNPIEFHFDSSFVIVQISSSTSLQIPSKMPSHLCAYNTTSDHLRNPKQMSLVANPNDVEIGFSFDYLQPVVSLLALLSGLAILAFLARAVHLKQTVISRRPASLPQIKISKSPPSPDLRQDDLENGLRYAGTISGYGRRYTESYDAHRQNQSYLNCLRVGFGIGVMR